MKRISVILIGAGGRGGAYVSRMSALPEKYKVVAVADPIKNRREKIQKMCDLPDDMLFNSWTDILDCPKMADVAIISTMDDMHYEPTLKAIELGYNLLLEKPAAQTAKECENQSYFRRR